LPYFSTDKGFHPSDKSNNDNYLFHSCIIIQKFSGNTWLCI